MKKDFYELFKHVFLSRKGITWFINNVLQVILAINVGFYSKDDNQTQLYCKVGLIILCQLVQLISINMIQLEKIKMKINVGSNND